MSKKQVPDSARVSLAKVGQAFNRHKVEYMLVGGVAVGYYGFLRISRTSELRPEIEIDLDFWYNPTYNNFYQLIKALNDIGFNTEGIQKGAKNLKSSWLKLEMNNFKIDLLPELTGLGSFRDHVKYCEVVVINEIKIKIIGYNDLNKNKEAVGRDIDLDDIKKLDQKT